MNTNETKQQDLVLRRMIASLTVETRGSGCVCTRCSVSCIQTKREGGTLIMAVNHLRTSLNNEGRCKKELQRMAQSELMKNPLKLRFER